MIAVKRTRYYSDEQLRVLVNSEEFHLDLDNMDEITVANIITATMPYPASPGSPETVIECMAEPSGGLSTVITPQKDRKSPETVLEALTGPSTSQPAKRGLFTSTPQPKRRCLRIIDEPSDHDSDPDYIPENYSVLDDSDCNSPSQDAPPAAVVPSPSHSPPGPPEKVLEALAGPSTSQPTDVAFSRQHHNPKGVVVGLLMSPVIMTLTQIYHQHHRLQVTPFHQHCPLSPPQPVHHHHHHLQVTPFHQQCPLSPRLPVHHHHHRLQVMPQNQHRPLSSPLPVLVVLASTSST